jgi:hypothetical protein
MKRRDTAPPRPGLKGGIDTLRTRRHHPARSMRIHRNLIETVAMLVANAKVHGYLRRNPVA